MYFALREKDWGVSVFPEQRVQVSATRFRISDVCVTLGEPSEQTFTRPLFIGIEILSPEDRMSRVRERVDDYLKMGVPHVWLLDPGARAAYSVTPAEGWLEEKDVRRTADPSIEMPLYEIFN